MQQIDCSFEVDTRCQYYVPLYWLFGTNGFQSFPCHLRRVQLYHMLLR
jgi:hypothetical protein